MKNKKLKTILALIVSIIVIGAIIATIVLTYTVWNIDVKILWIPLIVSIFLFEAICGLVMFSGKLYSDENKAFWLFFILLIPVGGAIFWLFIGREKQKAFGLGQSSQSTLLSHLFKAKKSIKIYSNSLFLSNDTIKAINYACWKNVKVEVVVSFDKKKWKNKLLKYDISRFLEEKVDVYFTDKEIEHNFVLIDDSEVLFSKENFNFKNMFNDSQIFLAQNISGYISLWNRDFTRSSKFEHKQGKVKWYTRFKKGLINIFYPFF